MQSSALNIYAMVGAGLDRYESTVRPFIFIGPKLDCLAALQNTKTIWSRWPTRHIIRAQSSLHKHWDTTFYHPRTEAPFKTEQHQLSLCFLPKEPPAVCLLHACAPFKAKESPTLFTMTFSTKHVWHCVNRNTASLRVVPHACKYLHGTEDVLLPFNSWLKHMVASN